MLLRRMLAIVVLGSSTAVFADAIDINLSNDVAQIQYLAAMGQVGQGKSAFHAGFLYNDSNNGMGDIGLMVMTHADESDVTLGVGAKIVAVSMNSNHAMALALGGQVRVAPLPDKKFGIIGNAHLAPDIVAFGDADRYTETGVRVEYEILPQAAAYAGYRKIKFGAKPGGVDYTLDEGIHIGVRVAF